MISDLVRRARGATTSPSETVEALLIPVAALRTARGGLAAVRRGINFVPNGEWSLGSLPAA